MQQALLLLAALSGLGNCSPTRRGLEKRAPKASVQYLGVTSSNLPNEYRDGGGGGQINGLNFMMFSDGIYTSSGVPQDNLSNWANFTSNSIACSGYKGAAITSLTDYGTAAKGPYQTIPFFYSKGESESATGIWPNQNIVTLCSGSCGVSFPLVVNRTAINAGSTDAVLYNTGVQITLNGDVPVATRPTQSLFVHGEPQYGSFSAMAGIDGYLYMFARITGTTNSDGIKLARVPQTAWSDRSQYRYWNGASFGTTSPATDDGGAANILSWSQDIFGTRYGPEYGDLFYSTYYGYYIMIFQSAAAALDPSGKLHHHNCYLVRHNYLLCANHGLVYMTYSSSLTGGWSTPVSIYQIPSISDGYSYSLHAYPQYDSTQRVVPLSWSTYSQSQSYSIKMANITFS